MTLATSRLRRMLFATLFCLTAAIHGGGGSPQVARAENWPQWRGAKLDGISSETNLPVKWSKTENVAWRLPLPGPAGATPAVWGDKIFLTSVTENGDLIALAVSTAGKELWRQTVATGNKDVRGDEGNSASPSPVTDGKHVWIFMANGPLACFTVDGKEVWKFDIQDRYGKLKIAFGMTASPLLDGDRLYLQLIHGEGNPKTREAMVVALDKTTGKEIWKHDRASDARDECEHSYASPVIYRDGKQEFLITHGADFVIAHSLADGHELWRCGELNPKTNYNPTLRFVASPVAVPGLIVVPSAKNGPVFAIKPDVKGDITNEASAFVWKRAANTPDVPSPLVHDGLVYLCRENGNLIVMDAKTGEQIYEKRTVADRHRASPVYADGKLYLTARKGVVTVVKAGRDFEILASNDVGEQISASPAIAGGRIYLRTFDALYAIGK
ncbi:MAG TPA: PQQ-binding-like beta-propeller repeat protein [Pirellulaceae bacterium]|nr:PQQ-binding-like beta-propeller repeat protein [Pirellulaceae bacterium]